MTAALVRPRSTRPPVIAPVDTAPVVTLRPAPRREPPFDDDLEQPTACRRSRTRRTLVEPALPFEALRPPTPLWRAAPLRDDGLPDPTGWARRLLLGMVESAGGRRPLHQLAAFLSPAVQQGLTRQFERSNQLGTPHWLCRATVRTVHASRPSEGVAELCAVLETGARARALAMRLERSHGRWRCVRMQIG